MGLFRRKATKYYPYCARCGGEMASFSDVRRIGFSRETGKPAYRWYYSWACPNEGESDRWGSYHDGWGTNWLYL